MATLNIRNISPEAAARIKRAARARDLTLAEYLDRLSRLHEALRQNAEATSSLAAELEALGLQTVSA